MVKLRSFQAEDENSVVTLWWNSWHSIRTGLRHPQDFAEFRARWSREIAPRHEVVIADDEGVVVGFAAADVQARVVAQIFVDPGRKRQGIGSQMLAWAQRRMPKGFRLSTLDENKGSRAFYEHHGLVAGGGRINPVNGMSTVEYRWIPATDLLGAAVTGEASEEAPREGATTAFRRRRRPQ